jgi:hypothetical protein
MDRGECGVDSPGSGYGPVAGSCEHGDEVSGFGATNLVSWDLNKIQVDNNSYFFYHTLLPLRNFRYSILALIRVLIFFTAFVNVDCDDLSREILCAICTVIKNVNLHSKVIIKSQHTTTTHLFQHHTYMA